MKVYHIFREGIQQDCCWFRYRADANKRLREHYRPSKEKIKIDEFDSLDDVLPCDVVGGLNSERCANCWRKIKYDYLKHIGDMNMKKEEKFVIDDSQNYNDMFSKKERMQINKATKPLENK